MLFGLVLTWVLIALTFIDFDTQLLPDRFTLPLAALGLGVNSYGLYVSTAAIWGYLIGFYACGLSIIYLKSSQVKKGWAMAILSYLLLSAHGWDL
jgi:leader peptidase (prepilin peptidase)/N-methyltransferase